MRRIAATLLVVGLLSACAGTSTTAGARRNNSNVLTAEQLSGTNSSNLFDAITKLRPEWLTTRGPSSVTDPTPTLASVYMGGSNLGKIDALRQVGILDVSEVRFWEAARASARFGQGHPRGVIELIRK